MRILIPLFAVAGTLAATPPPPHQGSPDRDRALHGEVGATGTIEGVVRLGAAPRRRATARYPGGAGAETIQDVPALVFLKGAVGAAPTSTRASMAQVEKRFDPALLVVPVGTVVEFPNHDPFFHNVFSYSRPARFDLGRYPQGESKEVRFDQPGVVRVYCEVHESMRAAIVVVENPFWARPDDEGRFRLEGVPAGNHTLVAWHTDRRDREVQVTVRAGAVSRVEIDL
jgi:plastocyanin